MENLDNYQRQLRKLISLAFEIEELEFFFNKTISIDEVKPIYLEFYPTHQDFLNHRLKKRTPKNTKHLRYNARMKQRVRSRVKGQIAHMLVREMGRIESLIGYEIDQLMDNLESKFEDGMSWKNMREWHIDHIKPRSLFSSKEIKECFDFSNLRPMWAKDNLKKGIKYE